MASGRFVDYMGKGDAADRPATPDLYVGAIGFYYAEDTEELSMWDGTAWVEDVGNTSGTAVSAVNTPANVSGTVTLDFAGRSKYIGVITLATNVGTLAFSNLPGAGKYAEYELHIIQDATGSRTFALPASHRALGGSDTGIASAANAATVLSGSTVDNGTTWRYAMQESA